MSLRFKGADLRPVLTEAIANQGRLRKRKKSYAKSRSGPFSSNAKLRSTGRNIAMVRVALSH